MDINVELFKRTAPQKKLEIINNLSKGELLNIKESTLLRIVKETGHGKPKSRNKQLYISYDHQAGNNWNSTIESIEFWKGKLILNAYVQYSNTDTNKDIHLHEFLRRGDYRGYINYEDRYGNQQTSYFAYDDSNKANVIKSICLEYIYTKYATKLTNK